MKRGPTTLPNGPGISPLTQAEMQYLLDLYKNPDKVVGVESGQEVCMSYDTWTVVPLLMFLAIFYFGWTSYDYSRRAPRDAMVVKVTGRQWIWSFQYPNGKQTDKLYAVLDRPMKLEVNSADILHGFYIPAFRLKVDAVPGRTNTTWFQPTRLGSFDIQCTVICGVNHSAMLSHVEVVRENEFQGLVLWTRRNAGADGGCGANRSGTSQRTRSSSADAAEGLPRMPFYRW